MAEMFETRLRRVGNSLGIIIPGSLLQSLGFGDGDLIQVAIPPCDAGTRKRKLMELVGADKGKSAFKREKGDRF